MSPRLTPDELRDLQQLLAIPTAPFREQAVRDWASQWLAQRRIPHGLDPAGNLLVGVGNEREYRALLRQRSSEPVRMFIAHMDHPGFLGQRWLDDRRLAVHWHGGSPTRHLRGARAWLAGPAGEWLGEGRLQAITLHPRGYAMHRAELHLDGPWAAGRRPAAGRLFGGLAFRAPVWRSGQRLYTKAADDLVGVHCILQTAAAWAEAATPAPFIGLLTRAEEVGFVGAVAHLQLGWRERCRRELVCISLEASRTLPGAEIGKGVIVRLGDRRAVFHSGAMQLLSQLAEQHLPGQHQRRIMDGGACEATATTAFGLPTIGITVPLGNYHNQGFEGGPDCRRPQGPAPEFVHLSDVAGMQILCKALLEPGLPWQDPWQTVRERLSRPAAEYTRLLQRHA